MFSAVATVCMRTYMNFARMCLITLNPINTQSNDTRQFRFVPSPVPLLRSWSGCLMYTLMEHCIGTVRYASWQMDGGVVLVVELLEICALLVELCSR